MNSIYNLISDPIDIPIDIPPMVNSESFSSTW